MVEEHHTFDRFIRYLLSLTITQDNKFETPSEKRTHYSNNILQYKLIYIYRRWGVQSIGLLIAKRVKLKKERTHEAIYQVHTQDNIINTYVKECNKYIIEKENNSNNVSKS